MAGTGHFAIERRQAECPLLGEPVYDIDYPPTVVRKVGWHRGLKCRRPFFSEEEVCQRRCSGAAGCRGAVLLLSRQQTSNKRVCAVKRFQLGVKISRHPL